MTDKAEEPGKLLLSKTRKALKPCLERNPHTLVSLNRNTPEEPFCVLQKPWNDESLSILAPELDGSEDHLIEALNNVLFPERLSALYHVDTKILEVPWTSWDLPVALRDIPGRTFSLHIGNRTIKCEYKRSSPRLLAIASASVLYPWDSSDHRGLASHKALFLDKSELRWDQMIGDPLSIYLHEIEWNEDKAIDDCRHFNFYTRYFDRQAPQIVIHEVDIEGISLTQDRYRSSEFPEDVSGRNLNPTLMSFWSAAIHENDPSRKYVYLYRLVEYVSFYHVDDQLKGSLKRALAQPNASSEAQEIALKVIEIVRDSKADDYGKFKSTITDLVDAKHIEKIVLANRNSFSTETKFDGGFLLKPLLQSETSDSIGAHGMDNFVATLRDIRNALSHGRDQKSASAILPTLKNFRKLQPWVDLMETAAAEVILYEGIF